MKGNEIRSRFLAFFKSKQHAIIPSASLVPNNDASVLFTTAGMHPLVPFLLGQPHPQGTRLANSQKCVRTGDIDDIGDNRHLSFFEMLGNWSLGDYFKKESINWSYEFLTNKEVGLGLDPSRLYVTVFQGQDNIPRDEESIATWKEIFSANNLSSGVGENGMVGEGVRITPLGVEDNFWIAGTTGPCGGDTEIFYDTRPQEGVLTGSFDEHVKSFRLIEIWNNVFMEYEKHADGSIKPLVKKNVDTGMGLERTSAVMQGVENVFETDMFVPLVQLAVTVASGERERRIISDHLRAAMFIAADGIVPSNTDRGYVLRRLIRRAVFSSDAKILSSDFIGQFYAAAEATYEGAYPELAGQRAATIAVLNEEISRFATTLKTGEKEFERLAATGAISGEEAFTLFQSHGFPIELTGELAKQRGITIDMQAFAQAQTAHKDVSRQGSDQKFKGGLAGTGEQETRYHTATHLLNAALRKVLGAHVMQRGSNITAERLRFDFVHDAKMTDEQKKEVENMVNEWIKADLPVTHEELPKAEAEKTGAIHAFGDKYGETVTIYTMGDGNAWVSKEFCGGPHVTRTGELGTFSLQKEEAVAAGIRRIKAVLN